MLDLIVVGLGVYGASVVAEAGARGLSVLGLERFRQGHVEGSSHGRSRILRLTTVEGDDLALRARRALDLWKMHDAEANGRVLVEAGFAIVQSAGAEVTATHDVPDIINRARKLAQSQQIAHEVITGDLFSRRFADYVQLSKKDRVFYEPHAYVLQADQAMAALTRRAKVYSSVELAYETPAMAVRNKNGYVEVDHRHGTTRARHIVLCTGPWLQRQLLGQDVVAAAVLPQLSLTTELPDGASLPQFPAFVHVRPRGPVLYGLPANSQLREVKFGVEQNRAVEAPGGDNLPADFEASSRRLTLDAIQSTVPSWKRANYTGTVCYYTKTPDSRHTIRQSGGQREMTVVAACSGHGFKFGPALAEEIVASFVR